jgi:predicted nucleic acid-binding Zn ribbon protein
MEVMQKISDKPLARHAKCGGKLEKEWSRTGFQFKGTGWYVTDYAAKKSGAKDSGESKTESSSKAETESSSKADSSSTRTDTSPKTDTSARSTSAESKSESKKKSETKPASTSGSGD